MKKSSLFFALPLVLLLWGCRNSSNNDIDITQTNVDYDVEICNTYFELAECIINNSQDENWTPEMKIQLKNELKSEQEAWNDLDEEELVDQCSYMLSALSNATDLDEIWCSIK